MQFKLIPNNTNISFTKWRMVAFVISAMLLMTSIGLMVTRGLNLGIDFRGGVTIEVSDDQPIDIESVRNTVSALGFGKPKVQAIQDFATGSAGVVITVQPPKEGLVPQVKSVVPDNIEGLTGEDEATDASTQDADKAAEQAQQQVSPIIQEALRELLGNDMIVRRAEVVGPTVSGELIQAGVTAVLVAISFMLLYIWFRFEWQFSIGAILALTHDVVLTLGVFSLTQIEFNLPIIAALLTIVGYSMNDTVVVYDRVRENLRKYKKKPLSELLDLSINDTLSRTMMTSVTTLLALIALYVLGGEVLRGFTFAMIWGVLVGTYSSIFVASPLLLFLGIKRDWSKSGSGDGAVVAP